MNWNLSFNPTTVVLLSVSLILLSGFLVTRLTKLVRLPNVTGYIVAGILIGPHVLGAIPQNIIDGMGFMADVALAFVAFSVGRFLKKDVLMQSRRKVSVITLCESLLTGAAVTLFVRLVFGYAWDFSLLLGAIASATAPASTLMTIRQYKAKGEFVNTLLQVVALDNFLCLFVFSVVAALNAAKHTGGNLLYSVLLPIGYNILALILGFLCAFVLSKILTPQRSRDNRLILVVTMLLALSGLCAMVDISPLLSCMMFGAAYINLTNDRDLFRQVSRFSPPVMSIFFIVSGMNLDLGALGVAGAAGLAYFFVRIFAKYGSTYLGCVLTKASKNVRTWLSFALVPQAGVAIGLAFLAQRMLPAESGNLLLTIILASSVLYEIVGPAAAKLALVRSGSIPAQNLKKPPLKLRASAQEGQEKKVKAKQNTKEIPPKGVQLKETPTKDAKKKKTEESKKPPKENAEKTPKGKAPKKKKK